LVFVAVVTEFNAIKDHAIATNGHLAVVSAQIGVDLITVVAGFTGFQLSITADGHLTVVGAAIAVVVIAVITLFSASPHDTVATGGHGAII
tara:strand:- start:340 stop:612 length:273 start_codon:yes stop_codon:yes gene_type:complete